MRIIVVAGGTLLLIVLAAVFFSILSSSGKNGTQTLISLAQEQNELVRVATIGTTKARSADALNLAATTQLSLESTQTQTVALLQKQGHKLSSKDLALKQDSKTDTALDAAAQNSTFDQTFIKLLAGHLSTYRTNVKNAYDQSANKTERDILNEAYVGVNTLLSSQAAKSN